MRYIKKIEEGAIVPYGLSYYKSGIMKTYFNGKTESIAKYAAIYLHIPSGGDEHVMIKLYLIRYSRKPWYKLMIVPRLVVWNEGRLDPDLDRPRRDWDDVGRSSY